MIGKIHLEGIPQGFNYSMVLPGQGNYYNPDFLIGGKKVRKEGYVTDIITNTALDWLKNKRDQNKPFCLLYHQKAPHREWMPAEKYYKQYTKMEFKEPETLFDDYEGRGTAAKNTRNEYSAKPKLGRGFQNLSGCNGKSWELKKLQIGG